MSDDNQELDSTVVHIFAGMITVLLIILGGALYVLGRAFATETTFFNEYHIITPTHFKDPSYYEFHYYDHTLKRNIKERGRYCSDWVNNTFKLGKQYKVRIEYRVDKYRDEDVLVRRSTDGCDLVRQHPNPM